MLRTAHSRKRRELSSPSPRLDGKSEIRNLPSEVAGRLHWAALGFPSGFGFRVSDLRAAAPPRRRAAAPLPPKTSLARVRPSLNSWRHWTRMSAPRKI